MGSSFRNHSFCPLVRTFEITGNSTPRYSLDVYDGKWQYQGTEEEIAKELLAKIDPTTVDVWGLAALVHNCDVGDILTLRISDSQ